MYWKIRQFKAHENISRNFQKLDLALKKLKNRIPKTF